MTTSCDLIFCMAGLYRRFREAGYTIPKYLLPWQETTILDHILAAYLPNNAFNRILLVANERDQSYAHQVLEIATKFGLTTQDLLFIGDTGGQAETALLGLEKIGVHENGIAFTNIDTVLNDRDWSLCSQALMKTDGFIDTFTSSDPAFSYVTLNAESLVTEIREKVVISPYATSGFYAFSDARMFKEVASSELHSSQGESYISDVYAAMILNGAQITTQNYDSNSTIVLGTPSQYESLLSQN